MTPNEKRLLQAISSILNKYKKAEDVLTSSMHHELAVSELIVILRDIGNICKETLPE